MSKTSVRSAVHFRLLLNSCVWSQDKQKLNLTQIFRKGRGKKEKLSQLEEMDDFPSVHPSVQQSRGTEMGRRSDFSLRIVYWRGNLTGFHVAWISCKVLIWLARPEAIDHVCITKSIIFSIFPVFTVEIITSTDQEEMFKYHSPKNVKLCGLPGYILYEVKKLCAVWCLFFFFYPTLCLSMENDTRSPLLEISRVQLWRNVAFYWRRGTTTHTHKDLLCTQTKDDNFVAVHVSEEVLFTEAMRRQRGGIEQLWQKIGASAELLLRNQLRGMSLSYWHFLSFFLSSFWRENQLDIQADSNTVLIPEWRIKGVREDISRT